MQIRRPLAAVLAALALFGGGATLTACSDSDPSTPNEGTTDDSTNTDGNDPGSDEQGNLPNNSDPDHSTDQDGDTSDPD